MADGTPLRVALLWYGDREARVTATFQGNRLARAAEALRAAGMVPEPAVYTDDFRDEVREQLLRVDGVLVWVNPIEQGRDRSVLDSLLEEVAAEGVFVSAHPEIIRKMGTKDVLVRTREMSWGCDTHRYSSVSELREQLPRRLAIGKPRVLKQYRGNGGNGVWKVTPHPENSTRLRVRHALRGSPEEDLSFEELIARLEPYFRVPSGRMVDQEYQERLTDGTIRCYLVRDQVAGFGHQAINALYPAPEGASPADAPVPGPRLYHPPDTPEFQVVRAKMEREWLPALCRTLDLRSEQLPVIWDADFLLGPRTSDGEDTYVVCEINVSSVYPFPDSALEPLASAVRRALPAHLEK